MKLKDYVKTLEDQDYKTISSVGLREYTKEVLKELDNKYLYDFRNLD